ncbi:MAG: hypothetical protein IPN48_08235 [Sphingomonadales bacterium]|nr:hypothetical protein [Sphingomonadales bacterium]
MITMLFKNGIPGEWELPTGIQFNAIGAMITRRYMHASGSTPEEMVSVCVTLRKWPIQRKRDVLHLKPLPRADTCINEWLPDPPQSYECPPMGRRRLRFVVTNMANAKKRHFECGETGRVGRLCWPLPPPVVKSMGLC